MTAAAHTSPERPRARYLRVVTDPLARLHVAHPRWKLLTLCGQRRTWMRPAFANRHGVVCLFCVRQGASAEVQLNERTKR